jgi:hypothetical protein
VIVDVVIVNSVMWAEGWERGERGKSQRVGQLLPDRGLEWMGIHHHEQVTGLPSKLGFLIIFARASIITACTLCKYRLIVRCVNANETLVCRLKINHA